MSIFIEKEQRMDSKSKSKPCGIVSTYTDECGIVLIAAVSLIAILALVGGIAVVTTNTDLKISSNYKSSVKALYAAKAGIEEARNRLRGVPLTANYAGDPAANPNPNWSAYILTSDVWQTSDDPNYNASDTNYIPQYNPNNHTNTSIVVNSLQTNASYWVKIRHKREYDAEQAGHTTTTPHYDDDDGSTATHTAGAPGNIVYYGYGDPLAPTTAKQFTTGTPLAKYEPVEIITAYGSSGGSLKIIEIEAVHHPGPPILAPVYSKDDIDLHGSSGIISGTDTCSMNPSLPPIYVLEPALVDPSGGPTLGGDPSTPQSGSLDIDIAGYINIMKDNATITITSDLSNGNYGDASNFVTCYSDTSNPYNNNGLKLDNVTGYGILLVKGDLILGGGFTWYGLVLTSGTLDLNGGGSGVNIFGSIFCIDTLDVNGGLNLHYDSCMIEDAMNNQPLKVIKWKEVY